MVLVRRCQLNLELPPLLKWTNQVICYTFTDNEFDKKSYHKKRMINDDYDDWKKAKQKVRDGLSAMFAVLMGQCHRRKDTEYVAMPRPCVMKLWIIVKRVCQGVESTNNCLMTAMEFMFVSISISSEETNS